MNTQKIILTQDEICTLTQIFNEVCNALRVKDFDKRIWHKEVEVLNIFNKIDKIYSILEKSDQKLFCLELNENELKITNNSFNVAFEQLGEWEFQTRIGVFIEEAELLQNKLINSKTIETH